MRARCAHGSGNTPSMSIFGGHVGHQKMEGKQSVLLHKKCSLYKTFGCLGQFYTEAAPKWRTHEFATTKFRHIPKFSHETIPAQNNPPPRIHLLAAIKDRTYRTWACTDTQRVLLHGARTGGTFLLFLEILPGEEAHRKWRVFPNACGWSSEAFG